MMSQQQLEQPSAFGMDKGAQFGGTAEGVERADIEPAGAPGGGGLAEVRGAGWWCEDNELPQGPH